ncbi:hypothetical protein HJG60_009449 [Phyllostomus discolor]|uniref:Uncharacterized protein n=1 Tax=Phyllostomus discolor TaxID=89673 RepID=A0A834DC34_9CHIR|nr:hypothetical protein HJG60_009449 [Phyllostomus discolor]
MEGVTPLPLRGQPGQGLHSPPAFHKFTAHLGTFDRLAGKGFCLGDGDCHSEMPSFLSSRRITTSQGPLPAGEGAPGRGRLRAVRAAGTPQTGGPGAPCRAKSWGEAEPESPPGLRGWALRQLCGARGVLVGPGKRRRQGRAETPS